MWSVKGWKRRQKLWIPEEPRWRAWCSPPAWRRSSPPGRPARRTGRGSWSVAWRRGGGGWSRPLHRPSPRWAEGKRGHKVLLHNGGFCNNCTPKRCLHNAHTRSISKQRHYKTPPFHTTATWKVWNFMRTTSLCSVWKKNFLAILY